MRKSGKFRIHGKGGRRGLQFTEHSTSTPYNARKFSLARSVTTLRREVCALRREVSTLKDRTRLEQDYDLDETSVGVQRQKPGRRPKINDEELFEFRDELVIWLETNWPDLAPKLYAAKTVQDVVAAISEMFPNAVAEQAGQPVLERTDIALRPFQRRLLESAESLFEFVNSLRFSREPSRATVRAALNHNTAGWQRAAARLPARQAAHAMAGVPEITWRTSLDRCSELPSSLTVGSRSRLARMYKLGAYWIQVEPEPGQHPINPQALGPFFGQKALNVRSNELKTAGRKIRISVRRPDKPLPDLPIPPGKGDEPRKTENKPAQQ